LSAILRVLQSAPIPDELAASDRIRVHAKEADMAKGTSMRKEKKKPKKKR